MTELTEDTPEGRAEILRLFESEFPPPLDGYAFVLPANARGVSLDDYRWGTLAAVPLLLQRVLALRARAEWAEQSAHTRARQIEELTAELDRLRPRSNG